MDEENKQELNEVETQVVCIYLCQMLGQPTTNQIAEVMKSKMNIKTSKIKTRNALNAAKKRGLLSINHIQDPENGDVVDAYSMKDVRFANPPEIAHIKNVLPTLLADPSAEKIMGEMEDVHDEGQRKGGRLPDIRDYVTRKVKFSNVLPVLGGKPFQEGHEEICSHRRIGEQIWIPGNLWLRAAIRDKLRQYNITDSKALYLDISDCFIVPNGNLYVETCPSPPQRKGGQGTGLARYEALKPGTEFEFEIKFPTTGGISEEIMDKILNSGLRIGARAKDYGLIKVIA